MSKKSIYEIVQDELKNEQRITLEDYLTLYVKKRRAMGAVYRISILLILAFTTAVVLLLYWTVAL